MHKLIIGTRGSRLALAQAEEVKRRLSEVYPHLDIELKVIKTQGDKRLDLSLSASGDKGLFTKELEIALMNREIDCAVHSLKDLPVDLSEGTQLGAILPREESNDALLGDYTLDTLPKGATVGTSSPRRAAQLLEQRPDLNIKEIRGNVESRIEKLRSGEYDAIVMAVAGLKRLGLEHHIQQKFIYEEMVPAPGQAAIAVQYLSERTELSELLNPIHCERTARCTEIERYILKQRGGGCALPFGCHCEQVVYKSFVDEQEGLAYMLHIYDLEDKEQTLKGLVVGCEATLEEIYEYSKERTVPIRRGMHFG